MMIPCRMLRQPRLQSALLWPAIRLSCGGSCSPNNSRKAIRRQIGHLMMLAPLMPHPSCPLRVKESLLLPLLPENDLIASTHGVGSGGIGVFSID